MFNSIKFKLVIWFLVVFSVFFTGLEIFIYYKLEDTAEHLADEHLHSEIQTLANLMAVEEAQGQLEDELAELSAAVTGVYAEKLSGHYYQITDPSGKLLVRSPSLSLAEASLPIIRPGSLEPDFRTITGPANETLRVVTQSFDFSIGRLTIEAGDSLEASAELLGSFRNIVLAIFPIVFILCGVGVFVVTGLALESLKAFSLKIGLITDKNLSERVDEKGLAQELKPLASDFNTMLKRLEESFSKQRQFLSDASHELRTPTSIIKSFCEITLSRERCASEYRDSLKKISESVNRMADIINRILVVSRLENKTIRFNPVKVDLLEIMSDVLKFIDLAASTKGIKTSLEGQSAVVLADKEGLMEVFTNLVENAIKYNVQGGRVQVTVSRAGDAATVSVADTGIGIPEAEREKIFDRFYRVDASRSVTVGSGLGLSIVKTIVESHGGAIEVKGRPGGGSEFTVKLPVTPEPKNGSLGA